MAISPNAGLQRKFEAEHELLLDCMHAMERTTRLSYSSPITGILLDELAKFHDGLMIELEQHADGTSLSILTEDQRIIGLRIQGLEIRCMRGDLIVADMNELIADWYRLHAIRHAIMEQANADTGIYVTQS